MITICRPVFLFAICLPLLAGCMTPEDPVRHYVLSPETGRPVAQWDGSMVLGVGPVSLPRHLDRPEVVRRLSSNQLAFQPLDQWAEPLDEMMLRILTQILQHDLGLHHVESFPWNGRSGVTHQVSLDVLSFDHAPDGKVRLEARWKVFDETAGTLLYAASSRIRTAPREQTVEAVVLAMSESLGALSREIAERLVKLR